ncbi:MAG TPA: DsrE family protein [Alphaproteobacteria bacterium]
MIDRRQALAAAAAIGASLMAARPAAAAPEKKHRVALHIDDNDADRMNMALNNASNITELYAQKGEEVEIEIVTYGPGLHMLRADTSPVKDRIKSFMQSMPNIAFAACANTMAGMKKREGHDIPLLPDVQVVPAGVVHLMERQEQGWSYIKP